MAVDPIRAAGDPRTRVAGAQTHALFEQHARMVYGLCRTLLRDPDDADDATQATFISAYRSLLAGTEVREPAAWLATIARNECATRARSRMKEPLPLLEDDVGHVPGPEAEVDRKALVGELRQAIADLPEKQREAVVLRDLYGLRYAEVGAALGVSVASVESLLFRARRSLRISLKPLAGGALTVPVAVREGIAQALPAFTTARAAGGGAASGAVGLGLLAKLTGGPAAVKAVAGVAAAIAAGSMAVAGVEHAERQRPAHRPPEVQSQAARAAPARIVGDAEVAAFVATPAGTVTADTSSDRGGSSGRGGGGSGGGSGEPASRSGDRGDEGSTDAHAGAGGARSEGHSGQPVEGEGTTGSAGSHDRADRDGSAASDDAPGAQTPPAGSPGRAHEDRGDPESSGRPDESGDPEDGADAGSPGEGGPDPAEAEPESGGPGHGDSGQDSDDESGDGPALPPS